MAAHTVKLGEDLDYAQELDRERDWKGYSGPWEHLMQVLRGKKMGGWVGDGDIRHKTRAFPHGLRWNQQGASAC